MAALGAGLRVYEDDEAQRNAFIENPGQNERNQRQTSRSSPRFQLPGIVGSNSTQARSTTAVDHASVGTAPLGGSSIAMVHRALDDEGIPASNTSNSVTFLDPDGRVSHPGRDSSVAAPGAHSFSTPAVNQPGRMRPPSNDHPQDGSRPAPAAAAGGARTLPPTSDAPYVRKLENQTVQPPPVHTSSPFMTEDPKSDYKGPPTPSRVFGQSFTGIPLRSGPGLDRPTPREESSSSSSNATAPVRDARWSAERQMAVSMIKSNTIATRFNGRDAVQYRRWKADLEDEVKELNYTAREWLGLLDTRTLAVANDMVR